MKQKPTERKTTLGLRMALNLGTAVVTLMAVTRLAAGSGEVPLRVPDLRIDGALHRIMHDGDFSPVVTIDPSRVSSTTFGVGAVAGLKGEITVIGGRCWISAVAGDVIETRVGEGKGVEATLLVTADVDVWSPFVLNEGVMLGELADQVRGQATSLGISTDRAIVFRVATVLSEVDGHVIDGSKITPEMSHEERHDRAVEMRRYHGQPATLVGFVSSGHEGVFTHRGETIHAHAVLAAEGVTVHVDSVELPEGTVIELGVESPADNDLDR